MSSATTLHERLSARAHDALRRGDLVGALSLIAEAEAGGATGVDLKVQKAVVRRAAGDLAGAVEALDEALAIDPYDYFALLSKGALVEKLSGERAAAQIYRNALKIAPAPPAMPPQLGPPTARARAVVARTADALEAYLRERLAGVAVEVSLPGRRRFEESLSIFSGRTQAYTQEPLLLHYPGLPAIPFHDRAEFPWLPVLEAATATIQAELQTALAEAADGFVPYIAYPPGAPVNQWGELNHSRRWSSLFLWKDGVKQDAACAVCPDTAALLESLPMAAQPGFAPTAVFSALDARTHIPPHTGSTNARLLVHLPLILPGPARFRVGNETRTWKMGEAWVFDDTIEHEAWNDADALRVILIFDIWNPCLDAGERQLITAMMHARNEFFSD
ncbi:aspartyl beta-hydroxylase [Phenylobacterium hankyongense]|uniref:Aspartyl beta-hydroxylase n=1 Tax=Phenylobacterium hankyongense TaxID=1813876 RepID=A0A328AYC1_9CAUL|nr:aspartyl/asparaginyl beta-hydroxylase domain-containing protein [Phenylobacterium hankyongense]RAK59649.1 aspartyl beta-hydroxylase [Phenylobacterium hankyongense]